MAPGTHALLGWWTANVLPLTRWDRFFVFLAGVLPDLDGLGLFYSADAYTTYHHILCHNLTGCIVWVIVTALVTRDRAKCALLVFLNWHLHLACDYFGSRGPMNSDPWPLAYLYPFVGGWSGEDFVGPSWYWNPWQWPLNSWPNLLVTLAGIVGWVYIAVRLNRTWFEFLWPRMDLEVCRMLRKWFGGQPIGEWSSTEARMIRRSNLIGTVATVFACVIAASRTL